jgi:hypothetical protein
MERLKTFASRYRGADPDGLIAARLRDLREFTAEGKQTDDLTMLNSALPLRFLHVNTFRTAPPPPLRHSKCQPCP